MTATLPFQLVSTLCLTLIIYGMSGLRPEPAAIAESCTLSTLMALIAVQARLLGGGCRERVGARAGTRPGPAPHAPHPKPKPLNSKTSLPPFVPARPSAADPETPAHPIPTHPAAPRPAPQVMHACAVIAPTQDMAFMYSIAWTTVQLLFNNFAITFKEITLPWLAYVKWVSAAYYAFEGLSVVEFEGFKVGAGAGVR